MEQGLQQGRVEGRAEGLEQGLEQGLQQGRAEGVLEGIKNTARRLKSMGLSVADIQQATGLSEVEIRDL